MGVENYRLTVVECDIIGCHEDDDIRGNSIENNYKVLRADGWRKRQKDGAWLCPDHSGNGKAYVEETDDG